MVSPKSNSQIRKALRHMYQIDTNRRIDQDGEFGMEQNCRYCTPSSLTESKRHNDRAHGPQLAAHQLNSSRQEAHTPRVRLNCHNRTRILARGSTCKGLLSKALTEIQRSS